MNELRWVLLLIGALVVVGILWWSRRDFERKEAALLDDRASDTDAPPATDTGSFVLHAVEEPVVSSDEQTMEPSFGPPAVSEPAPIASSSQHSQEKIICITVRAPQAQLWSGEVLLEALEREGLQFGLYDVFHRFASVPEGTNPAATPPLFTVANMQKPGDLNPKHLPGTAIAGLVLFISVTSSNLAIRAFTDMLSTARRLSTVLEGQVFDESGSVMTRQLASHMRDDIIAFQHSLRLSA